MLATAVEQLKIGLDGWKNNFFRDSQIELIAQQRNVICNTCEHRQPLTCGLCGCPLVAKTRARDATCPDDRW